MDDMLQSTNFDALAELLNRLLSKKQKLEMGVINWETTALCKPLKLILILMST